MADKSKPLQRLGQAVGPVCAARARSETPTLQQQREKAAKDVQVARHASRRQDVTHPAGADVKANKESAAKREEQAAERRAANPQRSNPSLLQDARDKELEAVRDINARQREEARYHGRTEIELEMKGVETEPGKDDGGSVFIGTAGGRVFVSCSEKEVVLDHNGAANLQKFAQQAFQAVS
jgi:hypothetical protein